MVLWMELQATLICYGEGTCSNCFLNVVQFPTHPYHQTLPPQGLEFQTNPMERHPACHTSQPNGEKE